MRLTKKLREEILEKAISDSFKARFTALVANRAKVAFDIVKKNCTAEKEALNRMSQVDRDLMLMKNNSVVIHVEAKGRSTARFSSSQFYNTREEYISVPNPTGYLVGVFRHNPHNPRFCIRDAEDVELFNSAEWKLIALQQEIDVAKQQINAVLQSFSTLPKLLEAAPEFTKYVPTVTTVGNSLMPIELVNSVRSLLQGNKDGGEKPEGSI